MSVEKLSKVPVNHRVLIHLHAFNHFKDKYEVPFDITQVGIAEHTHVHRAAAARALNELKEKDLVISQTKHVIRGNRNRKAYFLTYEGIVATREVEHNLLGSSIHVAGIEQEGTEEMEIQEVLKRSKGHLNLIDICNHLKGGILRTDNMDDPSSAIDRFKGEKIDDNTRSSGHYFSPDIPDHPHFEEN